MAPSTATLTSLAILRVNWEDHHTDYLDMLVAPGPRPIFADLLALFATLEALGLYLELLLLG